MRDLKRQRRVMVSALVIAAAGLAGVATASALLDDPPDAPVEPAAIAGSQSAEGRADDPRGGLPFGVVVWRNKAGETCAALGNRVGARITDSTGTRDYPVDEGGGCLDLASLPGDLSVSVSGEHHLGQSPALNQVTVVWGLAKPGISEVQVGAGRSVRVAKVTPRGAFVVTFPGAITSALDLVAITDDRRRRPSTYPAVPAALRDRILHPRTGEQIRREIAAASAHARGVR